MKRKKTSGKICLRDKIILSCVFIIPLIFCLCLADHYIKRFIWIDTAVTDIEVYISEEYTKYAGGDNAKDLFPEYDEICDNKSVSFFYENLSWRTSIFGTIPDFFALDICCDEDVYVKEKEKVSNGTVISTFYDGDYILYAVNEYDSGVGCICFNDETFTVRYLYVEDYKLDYNLDSVLFHNCSLNWSSEKK